ncbi:hypothetical protein Tco_0389334 [Tanacetum coccineum]
MKSQQTTNAFVKEIFMDLKTQLETIAKNLQASIQNLETKFDRLADKQSGQPSGSRNEHVNVVFTRSGKSYNQPVNPNNQQDNSETPVNFDSDDEEDEETPVISAFPRKKTNLYPSLKSISKLLLGK